jgi:amino acid adenylation domain-containing protein
MGVKRGDRVVIFLDNSAETVISLYGVLKAGGVFVIVSSTIKGRKLAYILSNSGARLLIAGTNKARVVAEVLETCQSERRIIWVGPTKGVVGKLAHCSVFWQQILPDQPDYYTRLDAQLNGQVPRCIDIDLAALIYTSGSTGEPKGVMSSHHNMVSAARSIIQYIGNVHDDIILDVLPLSFDYGLYQVIMAFMFGGTVVLEKSFTYLHRILEQVACEKVTGFPIVPTVLAMLLKMQDVTRYDFSSLRYMTNTGAALPVPHIRKLRSLFPHIKIFSMFGLTECKRVCFLPPEDLDQRPASVGRAMPNCEVAVVDEQDNEVPPGQIGELIVRGANVMQGYWQDPELTAGTYDQGRYSSDRILRSGDFFRTDELGYLYFLGRKDDMIKSKGERISAKEVENTICTMEEVVEAAVIAVPDEILGQAIKAFVVPAPGSQLSDRQLMKFCSENMEAFMVPKYVRIVDDLPRTPNGKIDKKQLKAREIE